MSCYLRIHFSKTCNCLEILMQTSPICTCAVEAQGAIPTCEGSVPTNKDLDCHRELSAWYLIHNPVLNRGEDPKLQCVWHCATSPVFVCARDPFFTLLAHCSVINQATSHQYGSDHKHWEGMNAVVLVSNSDGKQFQGGCQKSNHFSHFKGV